MVHILKSRDALGHASEPSSSVGLKFFFRTFASYFAMLYSSPWRCVDCWICVCLLITAAPYI